MSLCSDPAYKICLDATYEHNKLLMHKQQPEQLWRDLQMMFLLALTGFQVTLIGKWSQLM